MDNSVKLFRFLFLPVIFFFLVFLFPLSQAQAATLASVSDAITTSRPSASAPLVNDYATTLPSYSGNSMSGAFGAAVVGSQVWVSNAAGNTISLFNFNGTSAGSALSGNGLNTPFDIAVVGSQVWVVNQSGNTISLFNFNGTSAGSALSGNGLNAPGAIAVVGSQVWVANGGNNTISLFNFNGTSAGSVLSGNGLAGPQGIAVVGSIVWVTNTANTISLFNFNGTSAGSALSGNGLSNPVGVTVVGSQVWVANWNNNTISLFNFNGTSAGSTLSGNGLNEPSFVATVGSQVWVVNDGNDTISVWNTPTTQATIFDNGSIYLASDSATLSADTGETLDTGITVASMSAANIPSAGQRVVSFSGTVGHAHHKGDALVVANTAMHTIQFTTINAVPTLGKITIAFPSLRTGDSNLAASPSASTFQLNGLSDSNIKINGLSGAGTFNGTYTNPSNGTSPTIALALTGTTTIPAGTTITILIGCLTNSGASCTNQAPRIINPTKTAAAGTADTWALTITTRDVTNGVDLDTSKIRIGTVESILVQGTIDSTFTFTIAGVPDGTPLNTGSYCGVNHNSDTTNSGISTTPTNVNLGTLSNTASNSAAQSMNVQTNALNGYTITASSSGAFINPGNGYQIRNAQGAVTSNDTPVPALMNTGTPAFGIHACDANGKVNTVTWGTGGDKFANPSSSFYYTLVNSSVQPAALGDTIVVLYRATASGITPAGLYREVITYVATPVF